MSNDRSSSPISVPPSSARPRRASLAAGAGFADYLSKSSGPMGNTGTPASMTNAAANAQANHGRRLSITTLGLSGSPTQPSTFGPRHLRQGSVSSSAGSQPSNIDEALVEDNEHGVSQATPSSPFARRVSFGTQALRDVRGGSIGSGTYPSPASSLPGARGSTSSASGIPRRPSGAFPTSTGHDLPQNNRSNVSRRPLGEGFNWSEALRSRAERAPSIGGISPTAPSNHQASNTGRQANHQRAASIASMEQPIREVPKQPKQNKPDFFQEKILRGDFMD
ncbi:uncharacterized protein BDW47DRAFT_47997 [Aspergillus candidus]|uniref:Uncharacterized protein n=1 Tax=Aspergillus candidus TaxID=41067 RepID=A0A2I2F7V1_ASPCN|nr:hypothetical protein BDW47DRAFT_47997 [Aspergillus candidus]PLB36701.1 hypothetical protein BDW47DRAFT_47997 [Aspergillus candidus]